VHVPHIEFRTTLPNSFFRTGKQTPQRPPRFWGLFFLSSYFKGSKSILWFFSAPDASPPCQEHFSLGQTSKSRCFFLQPFSPAHVFFCCFPVSNFLPGSEGFLSPTLLRGRSGLETSPFAMLPPNNFFLILQWALNRQIQICFYSPFPTPFPLGCLSIHRLTPTDTTVQSLFLHMPYLRGDLLPFRNEPQIPPIPFFSGQILQSQSGFIPPPLSFPFLNLNLFKNLLIDFSFPFHATIISDRTLPGASRDWEVS